MFEFALGSLYTYLYIPPLRAGIRLKIKKLDQNAQKGSLEMASLKWLFEAQVSIAALLKFNISKTYQNEV